MKEEMKVKGCYNCPEKTTCKIMSGKEILPKGHICSRITSK